ncbi:hypothetical protein J6590_043462 [Homalodisca vitripennis]|nr:hypothetical protein J6590_043462 [Homalodisca vitripennis]
MWKPMGYGLIVWGGYFPGNLNRVLILQKIAIITLADLETQQSYRQAFQSKGIMTVTGLYIQGAILHAHQLNLQTGKDLHSHNTRHAANFVLPPHRTALCKKKPSYILHQPKTVKHSTRHYQKTKVRSSEEETP